MTNKIKKIAVFYGYSTIEEIYVGENKLGLKPTIKNIASLSYFYTF